MLPVRNHTEYLELWRNPHVEILKTWSYLNVFICDNVNFTWNFHPCGKKSVIREKFPVHMTLFSFQIKIYEKCKKAHFTLHFAVKKRSNSHVKMSRSHRILLSFQAKIFSSHVTTKSQSHMYVSNSHVNVLVSPVEIFIHTIKEPISWKCPVCIIDIIFCFQFLVHIWNHLTACCDYEEFTCEESSSSNFNEPSFSVKKAKYTVCSQKSPITQNS